MRRAGRSSWPTRITDCYDWPLPTNSRTYPPGGSSATGKGSWVRSHWRGNRGSPRTRRRRCRSHCHRRWLPSRVDDAGSSCPSSGAGASSGFWLWRPSTAGRPSGKWIFAWRASSPDRPPMRLASPRCWTPNENNGGSAMRYTKRRWPSTVQSGSSKSLMRSSSRSCEPFPATRPHASPPRAALGVNNARLYQRLTDEHVKLGRVYEIGRRVSGSLLPEEILRSLLEGVLEAYGGFFAAAYAIPGGEAIEVPPGPTVSFGSADAISGAVLPTEIIAARAAQLQAPYQEAIQTSSGRAWVSGVPLFVGERLWGAVLVWSPHAADGEPPPLGVLAATGQQAGLALLNAEQHASVQRRLAELTLIQGVASAIARRLETEAVLATVTERLHESLHFPAVQVYFREGDDFVLQTFSGPEPIATRMPVSRGIIGRVARTGIPAMVSDVRQDPDYVAGLVGTRSKIAVPVRVQDNVIAVINIESSDPSQIRPEDVDLLMVLADQVSVALQNAALYEQVRRNVDLLGERVRERTQQLEQALEQARAADRSKAQFVAEISHELRTPMTNISLYLDLLDTGRDDRRPDYMAILRHETERLVVLIEQLLAISEYDREKVDLHLAPVDLNALVRVLIGDRSRMIESRGLTLRVEFAEDLPKIPADSQLIMQVMSNLLTNATNYSPSGGVITLRTGRRSADGVEWVVFSIADTGPGIAEDDRPRVFERFFRGIVGRASGIPGTALGLAICKEIVEHHPGKIQLSAEGARGTTVTVWLREAGPEA